MNQVFKIASLALTLISFTTISWGQWGGYHFQRQLSGIDTTWHRIELPNELFQHTQSDLSDLRIKGVTAEGDTIEAPYLLEWPDRSEQLAPETLEIINQSRRNGIFYATLVSEQTDPISEIQLDLTNKNFDWRIRLEGSQDQQSWFTLLDNYRILAFEGPDGKYRFSTLHFAASDYHYYRIAVPTDQHVELEEASQRVSLSAPAAYRSYPIAEQQIRENREQQRTEINLELPWPVPVSALELSVRDSFDYYRPIRIEVLTDSTKTEKGWSYHYTTAFRGTLSSLEESRFSFPYQLSRSIRVYVSNFDNAPLHLSQFLIEGQPPVLTVRFTEPADYSLLYGRPDAFPPQYDLVRFADKIPEAPTGLGLGPEVRLRPAIPVQQPLFVHQAWLWVVLVAVIGLLGWYSLRMLSND